MAFYTADLESVWTIGWCLTRLWPGVWLSHIHTQPPYCCPLPSVSPACLLCSSLCLSFHAMDLLCLVNAPPFPFPCHCVLNACSSYCCHSGVWPGLRWRLPDVAQLAAQLHQEHELRQPCLPQDHRRGRGGRDPHRADWKHGTPHAPSPVPAGRQRGCHGSGRWNLPTVHRFATRGQHAWRWDSLVHRAAHAVHSKVTHEGDLWRRWPLRHTHTVRSGVTWTEFSERTNDISSSVTCRLSHPCTMPIFIWKTPGFNEINMILNISHFIHFLCWSLTCFFSSGKCWEWITGLLLCAPNYWCVFPTWIWSQTVSLFTLLWVRFVLCVLYFVTGHVLSLIYLFGLRCYSYFRKVKELWKCSSACVDGSVCTDSC